MDINCEYFMFGQCTYDLDCPMPCIGRACGNYHNEDEMIGECK